MKLLQKYIFLILFSFVCACGGNIEEIKHKADYENSPDIAVENLETIFNSSSRMQAKVKAPLMYNFARFTEPYMEFPKGLKICFYDQYFNITSSVTADYAIYYTKKKLWRASKNVRVTNTKGASLETDEIFGDEIAKKIYSLQYVKVVDSDSSVVEGKGGFVSNFDFTAYEFKDVSGILKQKVDL